MRFVRLAAEQLSGFQPERVKVAYIAVVYAALALLGVVSPTARPVAAAALVVLPLHYLVRVATQFDEQDYRQLSPILANMTNVRFIGTVALFTVLPVGYWYTGAPIGWGAFGEIASLMTWVAICAYVLSEGIYMRNFYFERWHLLERLWLIGFGALAIYFGPAFAPLFLLGHKIITTQFDYPDIGGFEGTHSRLPWTVLLIASAVAVVQLGLDLQPRHATFLVLCGFAAHYFHPGVAKLSSNGPLYYLRHNNPTYMLLNAYPLGWLSFLDEMTVVRIGQLSDRIKPLLNLAVIFIELGAILVLLSEQVAVLVVALVILLHLSILFTTGVDFWKWMLIDTALLTGLFIASGPALAPFGDGYWIALFVGFVVLAEGWMNPVGMGWLDAPYSERIEFEARCADGERIPIHPNIFRPYDPVVTQGATGAFTFLGENPRITFCLGAVTDERNKPLHRRLMQSLQKPQLDAAEKADFNTKCGVDMRNDTQKANLEGLLTQFLRAKQPHGVTSMLRYLASPREFYTPGISERASYERIPEFEAVSVYRIDGIWTADGFSELERTELLTVERAQ